MTKCHVGGGVSSFAVLGTLCGSFQSVNENLEFILGMLFNVFTCVNLDLLAPKPKSAVDIFSPQQHLIRS